MPWPTYSERFLTTADGAGWSSYRVPVGQRAVVRAVVACTGDPAQSYVFVEVAGHQLARFIFQAPTQTLSFATQTVVYGGEVMRAIAVGPGCECLVSGYLFADPLHGTAPAGADLEVDAGAGERVASNDQRGG